MQEKPLYFYMANLWSEVEKIFIWKERGDDKAVSSAYNRTLSIIERIKNSGNKSAHDEVSILERVLKEIKNSEEKPFISRNQMSSYLKPFVSRLLAV